MYGDKEFRRYYIQTWGVDLLGEQTREIALFAGLDDFYYLPSKNLFYDGTAFKIVD